VSTVTLRQPLGGAYQRQGSVLLANVVAATQGETVPDEVLGSGGGGPFQEFTLKKSPLTYLPATDAHGIASVRSTLRVTVNGILWEEQPTLLESPPNATAYATSTDESGQTTVHFGDGVHGARPHSGVDNIRARYRKGLGTSGNLAPGAVAQLLDSVPGVQGVTNPLPATGGADPEGADRIRARAPSAVGTFGRAVSLADLAALALSYPSVAKASAAWVARDPATGAAVAHPYIGLTLATPDLVPLGEQPAFTGGLRSFLDQRRDTNVPLRLADFTPVYVELKGTVDIDDRYPRGATLDQAVRALSGVPGGEPGLLSFERLGFGQALALGAVYAALLAVPGVVNANVITFRRLDLDANPEAVRDSIRPGPTELIVFGNDPTAPARGGVTLTRRLGGYDQQ
jgi:predicted phage baseplate assembly protein